MNSYEKSEILKDSIYKLYSKEGRSKSYISNLLNIPRKTLTEKIKEWEFPEAEPRHHLTPANQKFANRNRELIISRLNNRFTITDIANELKVSRDYLYNISKGDEAIGNAFKHYTAEIHSNAEMHHYEKMSDSSRSYFVKTLPGEIWHVVLGYENYEISNMGRIRSKNKKGDYYLLKQQIGQNGRPYVTLYKDSRKGTFQVSRLVAHIFVTGWSKTNTTVNYKDGNVLNNKSSNLEWVSQSENNLHSYQILNRSKVRKNKSDFKKVIYQNKYEFKTVCALAKFIGKSETQTRRYLEEPEKHNLKIIY